MAEGGPQIPPELPPESEEPDLLARVEQASRSGVELYDWWLGEDAEGYPNGHTYSQSRSLNRPLDTSFGFFDTAALSSGPLPVNGNVQEMFYDEPKTASPSGGKTAEWISAQVREFVLHYFMRISDYRLPLQIPADHLPPPPGFGLFSQCPRGDSERMGFGFRQLYYRTESGEWKRFRESQRDAIVDLRRVGEDISLLVLRNPIFDFQLRFIPLGIQGPSLNYPLRQFNYLVVSPSFIVDEERPAPGILGRYGFGYAFVRNPDPSLLAYGPGELEPAFESLIWTVHDSGEVTVRASFVAQRPEGVLNLSIDPFVWGFQVADTFGPESVSRALRPWKRFYASLPISNFKFDPVFPAITLLNVLTLDQARQRLCISREQIEKDFLFLHFCQHYQTILGSLQTWRQIPDWLDREALPPFVVDGRSS